MQDHGSFDERELLRLHNEARQDAGCNALRPDAREDKAAQAKADDMARHRYMAHDWPRDPGMTWVKNQRRFGVSEPGGENVARGFDDARSVHRAYMNSPSHRHNILNCEFRTVGFGYRNGYSAVEFGY